jgi:hypothetical protein
MPSHQGGECRLVAATQEVVQQLRVAVVRPREVAQPVNDGGVRGGHAFGSGARGVPAA